MRTVAIVAALLTAAAVAAPSTPLRTGAWEMSMEIESIEPATPLVQTTKGKPLVFGTCVTPDRLRASGTHLPFTWPSGECTPSAFSAEAGKVSGSFACRGDLGRVEMQLTGTYTPDSYDVRATEKVTQGVRGRAGLTVVRHTVGRLAGACRKPAQS